MLCPPKDFTPPSDKIAEAIKSDFGSLDSLISTFNASTAAVQGSGWGWLAYNPAAKKLVVATTANQDPLQATTGLIPILGMWVFVMFCSFLNPNKLYRPSFKQTN